MNQLAYSHASAPFYSGPLSAAGFANGAQPYAAPGQLAHLPQQQHQQQAFAHQHPGWWSQRDGAASHNAAMQPQQPQQQPYGASPYQQHNDFTSSDPIGRHSASPAPPFSPNAAANQQQQHRSPPKSFTPPNQLPMAAAPISQSPTHTQQHQPNATIATPSSTPQTPTSASGPSTHNPNSKDSTRVALLLEINQDLLAEITRLQASDQGGAINPQQAAQLKQAGQADKMASDDYIQLLRRLQGNLAYLMPRAGQGAHSERVIPGPAFMQHPPQMPQLADKYARLRELFPEWPGQDAKLMAMVGQGAGSPASQLQQQQQQGGNVMQQQQEYNANGAYA